MAHDQLLIPISLILVLTILSIKLVRFSSKRSLKLPPSPWKLPFIGNLHQLGLLPHQSLHKLSKKHGPLMLLQLGQVPTLVVSSSQMAKEILKTHDLIFASRPKVNAAHIMIYGSQDMAFAPYGEHWKKMRKIVLRHTDQTQLKQCATMKLYKLRAWSNFHSCSTGIPGIGILSIPKLS